MPDEYKIEPNLIPKQSWSQERISQEKILIRKIINPAIYVEKEETYMPPTRKTSPLSVTFSNEGYVNAERSITIRPLSTAKKSSNGVTNKQCLTMKRCTCISNPDIECQCHPTESSDCWETNSSSSTETQITVKMQKETKFSTEIPPLKITSSKSLNSLNSDRMIDMDPAEKEDRLKQWMQRKRHQQKLKKLEEEKMQQEKEKLRVEQLEQKKEVCKQWMEKKKQEEKIKKCKEKKDEEKKKMVEIRSKKESEREEMFQAWLKLKKKEEIEKKLNKKRKELKEMEDKKKRLEENQHAFDEWLKNSKNKPRPVPLNNGLASLCLSNSVTFVNPAPWVGNMEPKIDSQIQTTYENKKYSYSNDMKFK